MRTDDDGHGLFLADGRLAALDLHRSQYRLTLRLRLRIIAVDRMHACMHARDSACARACSGCRVPAQGGPFEHLVQQDGEVGLGRHGGGQLGDEVVVVGVEKLRHVQRLRAGHAARQRKVQVVAAQVLRACMHADTTSAPQKEGGVRHICMRLQHHKCAYGTACPRTCQHEQSHAEYSASN